ncbi:MAG: sigma 54-interacting transcriptional regulator [Planctomycetaceae bacterium]|jgi:Nif-specific regulatory protein|nr:sigma 54-interacting transcriptional regulator [Planctomycetaceae bacterium]
MTSEQAYLILTQNGGRKNVFSFTSESVVTLGRAWENFVSVVDDQCSRFHAKLFFNEGSWYLQDLGSRNGTFVDNQNITSRACPLRSGQHIVIGRTILQFGTGPPTDENAKASSIDDSTPPKHHTGVFGISESLQRPAAEVEAALESEILFQKSHTTLLKPNSQGETPTTDPLLQGTKTGFGPAEMCQLAYQIGKAEDVDRVARAALEGLLAATGAEGAGLWLFPYRLHSQQQASDIRLVSETTLNQARYIPISTALARTVFEKREAFLVHENPNEGTKKSKKHVTRQNESAELNNTLVAPIRYQNGILGMLHLYTTSDDCCLDESDLEYALAIADTVGVALENINKQNVLATNLTQVRKENINLREMLQMNSEIIGNSPQIQTVHHLIGGAAEGKTAVLIRGESGTGKELIARAVHLASPRKSKPLVCLNCAAISETLLESELFGYEKGAFTGAAERKIGRFEAADSGTLFLDEIGEMTPSLQAKMLRVIENNTFERVGGNATIHVDVRIVTATNRDLEKDVAAGRFRHDLFFRLRVLEIIVPPLRKRPTDIPLLAEYFLNRFCNETGRKYTGFHPDAMETLMDYRYPGNVRELKNIIERAVVLGHEPLVEEQDLLLSELKTAGETHAFAPENQDGDLFIPLSLNDIERNHIIRTLEHTGWNKSLASKQLGIERTTLDRKIKRYNIER